MATVLATTAARGQDNNAITVTTETGNIRAVGIFQGVPADPSMPAPHGGAWIGQGKIRLFRDGNALLPNTITIDSNGKPPFDSYYIYQHPLKVIQLPGFPPIIETTIGSCGMKECSSNTTVRFIGESGTPEFADAAVTRDSAKIASWRKNGTWPKGQLTNMKITVIHTLNLLESNDRTEDKRAITSRRFQLIAAEACGSDYYYLHEANLPATILSVGQHLVGSPRGFFRLVEGNESAARLRNDCSGTGPE